jgi:hypothetical protein
MPKHSGNFDIFLEPVKQPSVDYNLATGHAHCIDHLILDNDHLPVEPSRLA